MKLEYTIFWFDDQPHNLSAMATGIEQRLAREGFKLKITWVSEFKDQGSIIKQLKNEEEGDLILMDWNLGAGTDGAVLSKRVRGAFRYTDIMFYSSAPTRELRRAIFEQDIDGVYCCHRNDLVTETMGVVHHAIRKVIDLNHMRGLVMAAVADLDHGINECLHVIHSQGSEEAKSALKSKIVAEIIRSAEDAAKQAKKVAEKGFDILMEHRAFSTALRHKILQGEVRTLADEQAAMGLIERLDRYMEEVVHPRNLLGHARPIKEGGKLVFPGGQLVFDQRNMALLRQNLIAHRDNLADLLQVITRLVGSSPDIAASVVTALTALVDESSETSASISPPDIPPA